MDDSVNLHLFNTLRTLKVNVALWVWEHHQKKDDQILEVKDELEQLFFAKSKGCSDRKMQEKYCWPRSKEK